MSMIFYGLFSVREGWNFQNFSLRRPNCKAKIKFLNKRSLFLLPTKASALLVVDSSLLLWSFLLFDYSDYCYLPDERFFS